MGADWCFESDVVANLGRQVDGLREGAGAMTYANGRKYDGAWVKGKMEGHGVETWPDGDVYDGAFVGNKREGQGKMTYSDGEVHDGTVLVFFSLLFLFPGPPVW